MTSPAERVRWAGLVFRSLFLEFDFSGFAVIYHDRKYLVCFRRAVAGCVSSDIGENLAGISGIPEAPS